MVGGWFVVGQETVKEEGGREVIKIHCKLLFRGRKIFPAPLLCIQIPCQNHVDSVSRFNIQGLVSVKGNFANGANFGLGVLFS